MAKSTRSTKKTKGSGVFPYPPGGPHCTAKFQENDPHGTGQHTPGAKLDSGKLKAALVLDGFAHALERICVVGTAGANKYSEGGWLHVPDAIKRYKNASRRHELKGAYEKYDKDLSALTGEPVEHLAAKIWNDLAVLELLLQLQESTSAPAGYDAVFSKNFREFVNKYIPIKKKKAKR